MNINCVLYVVLIIILLSILNNVLTTEFDILTFIFQTVISLLFHHVYKDDFAGVIRITTEVSHCLVLLLIS